MRRPSIACLAVLALALPACGGSEGPSKSEQFAKDYKPLNAQLIAVGDEISFAIAHAKTMSTPDVATNYKLYADKVASVNKGIADLDPPEDLEADVGDLTERLGAMQKSLAEIAAAAGANDVAASQAAARRMVQQSIGVNEAQNKVAAQTGADKGRA